MQMKRERTMRRFSVAMGGIAALALIAWLVAWPRLGSHSGGQAGEPAPAARESRQEPARSLTGAPGPMAPPDQAAAVRAAGTAPDPYGMPPPSPDQIRPPPAPPVVTEADHQATRQAARELVEHGIARLEREGQAAAQAGDAELAQRNAVRVARLRKRLATLKQEPAEAP